MSQRPRKRKAKVDAAEDDNDINATLTPIVADEDESLADSLERVLRGDEENETDREYMAAKKKWEKLDPKTAKAKDEMTELLAKIRSDGTTRHAYGRSFWKLDCFIILLLLVTMYFIGKTVYDIDLVDLFRAWYDGKLSV